MVETPYTKHVIKVAKYTMRQPIDYQPYNLMYREGIMYKHQGLRHDPRFNFISNWN